MKLRQGTFGRRRSVKHRRSNRLGALLSVEMLFIFPVIMALFIAITELSLLWSANHVLKAASFAAAREAALPASDDDARRNSAKTAAELVPNSQTYIDDYEIYFDLGTNTGDPVKVTLTLPMTTASPDFLAVIGISITGDDKLLTATTITRRE